MSLFIGNGRAPHLFMFPDGPGRLFAYIPELHSAPPPLFVEGNEATQNCGYGWRDHGATLIIAKIDRLARNVYYVSGLMESKVK